MKRVWRLAQTSESNGNGMHLWLNPKPILSSATAITRRHFNTPQQLPGLVYLFTSKDPIENVTPKASLLKDDLVREASDSIRVLKILDDNSDSLIRSTPLFFELLNQLDSWPSIALQVLNWKRNRKSSKSDVDADASKSNTDSKSDADTDVSKSNTISANEYSKGIKAAGRSKNVDLAVELFKEASDKGVKTTSTYNALMGAYMFSGLADRCYSLFLDMKKDPICSPSIVTYNIVISVFGRLMLIDHMETAFNEIKELQLLPNIFTYNYLIAGYLCTWMWDDMEKVFQMLKSSPLEPNSQTYVLMIRGYAHSGNLVKMEEMYSSVRDHVNQNEMPLIRNMIVAYCKSSEADRVKKIEALLKLIPEEGYRPWLNVLLIKLYAKSDCLKEMEDAIDEAFEHKTPITTMGIMRCIITAYYRCNALEKLEIFVRRAAFAGWKMGRSLFHCKLVMLGAQKNFNEMHNVLQEMNSVSISSSKRTLWIMYKAYWNSGQRFMVLKVLGQMFKHGYEVPGDAFPS